MPVYHINFNLNQGIEGLAQSPAHGRSLELLPHTQQVLPSNSLFSGSQLNLQNLSWIQANSKWDTAIQQFVMPNISSKVLLPYELKSHLLKIRKNVDKLARDQKSATLRDLSDVLQDDADLHEMLHNFRAALMRA